MAFNMDGNFDAVMGLIGCIIGLEETYNISRKKDTVELTDVEKEFNKLIINNRNLFNEKFSNAETQLR